MCIAQGTETYLPLVAESTALEQWTQYTLPKSDWLHKETLQRTSYFLLLKSGAACGTSSDVSSQNKGIPYA